MYPIHPCKWGIEARDFYKPELQNTDSFYNHVKSQGRQLIDMGSDHEDKKTIQAAIEHTRNFQNAVDVGCRDGLYTRYLMRHFHHCFAFDYRYHQYFAANVDTQSLRVTSFRCALGATTGQIRASGRGDIRSKKINPNWSPLLGGKEINVYTLDQFCLEDVGLLKVDVDGMDEDVLRGSRQLIRSYKPVIIVEQEQHSTHDAIAYLQREFDYKIKFQDKNKRNTVFA